jgi:hypothetical protein
MKKHLILYQTQILHRKSIEKAWVLKTSAANILLSLQRARVGDGGAPATASFFAKCTVSTPRFLFA